MKPLTEKQKKAAWIIGIVLVFVHFLPDMVHALQRSLFSHRQAVVQATPNR